MQESFRGDETTISVTGNRTIKISQRHARNPIHQKYLCGTYKFPDKIMVWGYFSYHGLGKLIMLPNNETVNKESYL